MRLLNTKTLQLEEFCGKPPKYAILSHRWEADEVSYKDFELGRERKFEGYSKIYACCRLAYSRRLKYAWVDTCCIDKRSCAELTESINSMYQWYQEAEECYAFLNDVHVQDLVSQQNQITFGKSAWFTRGWTLQELIAPSRVFFYNSRWMYLGSKDDQCKLLKQITGIGIEVLQKKMTLSECTISQRMSWAAYRITSRLEDRAYSLLGIFGVNMPMLYGEGDRAFRRLQEEIIKQSDDHTIFAWRDQQSAKSVLAPSPLCFRGLDDMERIVPTNDTAQGYAFVNAGLSIQLLLVPWSMNTYIASLHCGYLKMQNSRRVSSRGYERACIFLQQTEHDNQFTRVSVDGEDLKIIDGDVFARMRDEFEIRGRQVLIRQPNDLNPINDGSSLYGFELSFGCKGVFAREQGSSGRRPRSSDVLCYYQWEPETLPLLQVRKGSRHAAGLLRLSGYHNGLFLYLGFDLDFAPLCLITTRTPWWDPQSRRFSLLPNFETVSEGEALRLLDLKWLMDEVAHGTQYGETILAWKGDRRTRTVLQCRSLSLTFTFEWKRSKTLLNTHAWHVTFSRIHSNDPAGSNMIESDDVILTAGPLPSAATVWNTLGDIPNMRDQHDMKVDTTANVSGFARCPPSARSTVKSCDVTISLKPTGTMQAPTYRPRST